VRGRGRPQEIVRAGQRLPVADLDARIHEVLGDLGVDVDIRDESFGFWPGDAAYYSDTSAEPQGLRDRRPVAEAVAETEVRYATEP